MASAEDAGESRDEGELRDWLRLNLIRGIGPRTIENLVNELGGVREIFRASPAAISKVYGVGQKLSQALLRPPTDEMLDAEIALAEELGVSLFVRTDAAYPRMLKEIVDPPAVLSVKGTLTEADTLAVALVGSRNCTEYGRRQAEQLAGTLARAGVTIVSGLARGIDASAHLGALRAGGRTIAVCANGLQHVYPPEHRELAAEVAAAGALVSESPLGREPVPGLFPQRNRIISGLSLGVVIVEAPRASGALHTARHAMEQGREVFAVPGRIDTKSAQGCHDLIRDGAQLVRDADDILEALGPLPQPVETEPGVTVSQPRELNLTEQEQQILNLVGSEPVLIDHVIERAEIEPSRVLATLTILEMKKLVRRSSGNWLSRG